ncbi:hypothetical protein LOD99_15199 [Oopsacas minuta]|uniref:Uncharacterized protein n=1 Tax=Oopsacas minuta TaxID=111878 RepID=A0AAV7KAU9_9METZ|nr:hypothetical protein LOD99_15199 [Oopsacas minuta]
MAVLLGQKLLSKLIIFHYLNEHDNHESTEREIEIMKVTSKLKRKSEYSQGSLREIFDDEVNQSEVGGFISFAQLESTMYKRKRLCTPEVPLNARTAMSLMEDPGEEFKMYHAFSIEELDEVAIAFMSPKWKTTCIRLTKQNCKQMLLFMWFPSNFINC